MMFTRQLGYWEKLCADSRALRFIDVNLRGIGQVMFQDNPVTGLLFLIAICWGSYAADALEVAAGGLLALVSGTLMALWLRVEKAQLNAGLFGFNAYLVGLTLPTFMATTPALWVYLILGGALSVIVMLGLTRVMATWKVSPLTAPFVLVAWLLLLATNAFSGLQGGTLPPPGVIAAIDPAAADPLKLIEFLQGLLTSISQVFLKGDGPAALLLLAGLAVNSARAAGLALLGALVAVITAHMLGAESQLISAGLLGFNPVLTAIALGAVFYRASPRVLLYTLFATVVSVLVQGTMIAVLTPFGIPTLTAAFILVTWLFLLPAQKLE